MRLDNPVYDLLVEALDCSDRLPMDSQACLAEAIHRAYEVIELPHWLPEFEMLVAAMATRHSMTN
jgi:hypothetical protein